jgi:hypothetical protein
MDIKKFFLAGIVGSVVMFLLAGMWNTVIVRNFIEAQIDPSQLRSVPVLYLVILGYLVLGFLMAIIYPRFAKGGKSVVGQGLMFGIIAGALWMLPYSLVLNSIYNFPFVAIGYDTIWVIVEQGIGGIVIAMVYGEEVL